MQRLLSLSLNGDWNCSLPSFQLGWFRKKWNNWVWFFNQWSNFFQDWKAQRFRVVFHTTNWRPQKRLAFPTLLRVLLRRRNCFFTYATDWWAVNSHKNSFIEHMHSFGRLGLHVAIWLQVRVHECGFDLWPTENAGNVCDAQHCWVGICSVQRGPYLLLTFISIDGSAISIIETDIEIFCHIESYWISACWRSNRSIRVGHCSGKLIYLCNALSPWWSESRHLRVKLSLLACGGDKRGRMWDTLHTAFDRSSGTLCTVGSGGWGSS